MNIDKNEELKYRNYNNEELKGLIYNQVKLVCERDMGIVFPDKPSKETEERTAKLMEEIVVAIRADFPKRT